MSPLPGEPCGIIGVVDEVRQVGVDDWCTVRALRLAALADAPAAFASTYQREVAFSEADWRDRLRRGVTFLASVAGEPVGMSGGVVAATDTVELVGMWVSPRARGRGLAQHLVRSVREWAD